MKETIQKASKLSHDGYQLITRIPREIEKEAQLKKGDALLWTAKGKKLGIENMGSHEEFMKKVKKELEEKNNLANQTKKALSGDAKRRK